MPAAIGLETDFTGAELRARAAKSCEANQARRLICIAAIADGASRSEAAKLGSVDLQDRA